MLSKASNPQTIYLWGNLASPESVLLQGSQLFWVTLYRHLHATLSTPCLCSMDLPFVPKPLLQAASLQLSFQEPSAFLLVQHRHKIPETLLNSPARIQGFLPPLLLTLSNSTPCTPAACGIICVSVAQTLPTHA